MHDIGTVIFYTVYISIAGVLIVIVFLMPYLIARSRDHRNKGWILFMTILGWGTFFIPWFIALGWAMFGERNEPRRLDHGI